MATVLESLINAVQSARRYNPDVEVEPACILWPDGEGEWSGIVDRLLDGLPELIVWGAYDPARRQGPAIWLRAVLAAQIDAVRLPPEQIPIVYLPGVSRQQLRNAETCPDELAPLVELQYRGAYWSQANTRDWSLLAFLKARQGGLGLHVAQDEASKQTMRAALSQLLNEDVSYLAERRLDTAFFNRLIAGGDPARVLLQWLDHGDDLRKTMAPGEWRAFVALCLADWEFNPETEGPLVGAAKLAAREGPWGPVWDRFCEAPQRYPHVPDRLRMAEPPRNNLLWATATDGSLDGWPQWNEEQEDALRRDLGDLSTAAPETGRARLLELEAVHGRRRATVWAELGAAPLAQALGPLSRLASVTIQGLQAGTIDDVVAGYAETGWQADDAVLRALALVHGQPDVDAVTQTIRCVYLPWVDEAARYLQQITEQHGYPGATIADGEEIQRTPGTSVLFVDGLRFDAAKRLVALLRRAGLSVSEQLAWAAPPGITATAKPAVSPVRQLIRGDDEDAEFRPVVAETGQALVPHHFKRLLREAGWQTPGGNEYGDTGGSAWHEFGDIDRAGHNQQLRLARQIDDYVREISDRIVALLAAGWRSVRVVTDHGWLLVPGGLPKAELPSALTETKWGRFALLKPGAVSNARLFPWYWNPDRLVAVADGVRSFRRGLVYAHGGLSLQECLTLHLTVTKDTETLPNRPISIVSTTWQGLRCRIVADGSYGDLTLDIRLHPEQASSSVVAKPRTLREDGTGSVVVEDDGLIGKDAMLVLVAEDDRVIALKQITIGGDAT